MTKYLNLNGDSGVTDYEIGDDFIRVRFKGPHQYLYTYSMPSRSEVETMKKLAREGKGLGTFISQFIRKRYAKQEF